MGTRHMFGIFQEAGGVKKFYGTVFQTEASAADEKFFLTIKDVLHSFG